MAGFEDLPSGTVVELDRLALRPLIEYVARRLDLDDGEHELVFRLSNGRLRESSTERRRIRNEELEYLGRVA